MCKHVKVGAWTVLARLLLKCIPQQITEYVPQNVFIMCSVILLNEYNVFWMLWLVAEK